MPQMLQVLRECAIGMMTAGMSSKAVELNVNLSTMSRLQRRFREFGSTSNLVTTPAQDLHIQHLHLQDQPLQQSVCIIKVFLQKLSETVSGKLICMLVFLIVVSTWLQFVIVTDLFSSQMNPGFHCTGADGRQRVWCRVGDRFADVNVESSGQWWQWGYGTGKRMLWTTNTGALYWWHFECTEKPWRDPGAHCCAIHPRPSPHVAAWSCACKHVHSPRHSTYDMHFHGSHFTVDFFPLSWRHTHTYSLCWSLLFNSRPFILQWWSSSLFSSVFIKLLVISMDDEIETFSGNFEEKYIA